MKTKDRVKKSRRREVVSFERFGRAGPHVIPAKAGIHLESTPQALGNGPIDGLDYRFRGNDGRLVMTGISKLTEQTGNVYENKGQSQEVEKSRSRGVRKSESRMPEQRRPAALGCVC